jgi:hypothetical protein
MHTFLNHNKMWPSLEDMLQENIQNIADIQTNANQMGEGNANIVYELGRLHLAPPGQFIGGAVQSYHEQGYTNQDYQYQPPTED